ncbi:MAG: PilN domain-containing protein [Bacillota bacterium]
MSIIFKEKNYNQIVLILKHLLLIIFIILILVLALNLFLENKNNSLNKKLVDLKNEEFKYKNLLKTTKAVKKVEEKKLANYYLLIKLANYAEKLSYKSIHFKNKKINLTAVTKNQTQIFKLVDNLKKDFQFKAVNLININSNQQFDFKLEAFLVN